MFKRRKEIAPHPGEVLAMVLSENKVTQTLLASAIGVPQTKISQICRAKLGISAEMAMKLEKSLGMKATLWLNLQKAWELSQVSTANIKKVKRLKIADKLEGKEAA